MLTKNILLKSFSRMKAENKIKKKLQSILKEKNHLFESMSKNYRNHYNFQKIKNFSKKNNIRLIGMGGSVLGSQAIYNFLKDKIKKKFFFIDNLNNLKDDANKGNFTNLIISKSGNTLETISNANIYIKKKIKIYF